MRGFQEAETTPDSLSSVIGVITTGTTEPDVAFIEPKPSGPDSHTIKPHLSIARSGLPAKEDII